MLGWFREDNSVEQNCEDKFLLSSNLKLYDDQSNVRTCVTISESGYTFATALCVQHLALAHNSSHFSESNDTWCSFNNTSLT